MTDRVGPLLKDGLVMFADTRTNAGFDNVSILGLPEADERLGSGASEDPSSAQLG